MICHVCTTVTLEPSCPNCTHAPGTLPALVIPAKESTGLAAQRLASAVANIAAIVDDPLIAGRLRGALHAFDEDSR